jgi:voltage-dependent potassium channel beta subunit
MEYRKLGKYGLQVSVLSLGAWLTYGGSVGEESAIACVRRAIEQGVNFIDVADAYANGRAEEAVGRAIKGLNRSNLIISTKAYWPMTDDVNDKGLSRKHIMESVHKSLKRFNLDYVDIFFCHRFDPETPLDETIRAIDDLIHQGKILYWGTSMWSAQNIRDGVTIAKAINANPPAVEQPRYSMLSREIEGGVMAAASDNGMGIVAFSPLAQGLLTGKYNNGIPEDSRAKTEEWFGREITEEAVNKARGITALAQEMGITPSALALAWVIRHPQVSCAITGASKPSQVDENLKALDVKITDEINKRIESILQNKPVMA